MLKKIIFIFLITVSLNGLAQSSDTIQGVKGDVEMPEFPGGEEALRMFIRRNMQYPSSAFEKGIEGKVVVTFVVKRDSTISDVKTISKNVDTALAEEAIRIVSSFPKFKPAKRNGEPIDVKMRIPIVFRLDMHDNSHKRKENE